MTRQTRMPLERRSHRHGFLTLGALKGYFAAWLPEEQIDAVLAQSGQSFRKRDGISEAETNLQLISKAERALLRILQSGNEGRPYSQGPR